MKLLFIGDIVARPGRDLVRAAVATLVKAHDIDLVVANAENAAGGAGITRETAGDLFKSGVHVLTSGNHVFDKREALDLVARDPRVLRPANYPRGTPGAGAYVWTSAEGVRVGIVNVMGRVFMAPMDDPFVASREQVAAVKADGATIVLVDVHAEATSEKLALGWSLDGEATAVVGTHTHVQTADERVLPGGTAYITDVGMTGPHDGIIGMDRAAVLTRFRTALPARADTATGDPRLHGVIVTADPFTGYAQRIERLSLSAADIAALHARHVSQAVVTVP
jgi:hypothetical protein